MINAPNEPNIAFVHDWLTTFGGAEQILAALLEVWSEAPVYTLVHDPDGPCGSFTVGKDIRTSFIQRLPGAKKNHRRYLPLMPLAVEQFDLRGYQVIISISHAVAHGMLPQVGQLHINYICIPMRYAWHLYHEYLQQAGLEHGVKSGLTRLTLHYLRLWDAVSTNRVDQFVAISKWVAKVVRAVYHRPTDVIYPPVDISAFTPRQSKENFYLTVSRLVPYKKIDLIIAAFNKMPDKKLVVIGDGPDLKKLKSQAGKNIEFLGYQPLGSLVDCLQRARAFVFAAVEDFGIAPVEAQACGTPVIAYAQGGVLETVIDGRTGILYPQQTVQSLQSAIQSFENRIQQFDIQDLRTNSERFNKDRFKKEISAYIERRWIQYKHRNI